MPKGPTKLSVEDRLHYILTVISYAELSKPDYQAVMAATGQSNPNNAQKRFKACIEQAGFGLVDRQIVRLDDSESNDQEATSNVTTKEKSPKSKKASKAGAAAKPTSTKPATKRARQEAAAESAEADEAPNNKRPKSNDVIELSDDEEDSHVGGSVDETVKVEILVGENENPGDIDREEHTETDDTDAESEEDRLRRSRARSRTVKTEAVIREG